MFARERDDRVNLDARQGHVEQEESDTLLRLAVKARTHEAEHHVRVVRMRGPDLGAIKDIVVTVGFSLKAETGQIRSRTRLGIALTPIVLASEDARQIMGFLLGRSVPDDAWANHGEAHGRQGRCPCPRTFGSKDIALHLGPARAAIFDRPGGGCPALGVQDFLPWQAELRLDEHTRDQSPGIAEFFGQVVAKERSHFGTKFTILSCEIKVHNGPPGLHDIVAASVYHVS